MRITGADTEPWPARRVKDLRVFATGAPPPDGGAAGVLGGAATAWLCSLLEQPPIVKQ